MVRHAQIQGHNLHLVCPVYYPVDPLSMEHHRFMTDYIRAYDNPTNIYYREARKLADDLRTETILELPPANRFFKRGRQRGVLRWKSNNAVVPDDATRLAYAIGIRVSVAACKRVRDAELAKFFSEYRDSSAGRGLTAEESVEARAAFGRGAKVINIITGRETVL